MDVGQSEAETFWVEFLRKLARRGLRKVKLVISDAHEGLKTAITRVFGATWQRCRVHLMRNLLAHAGRQGHRLAAAFIATAFAQEDATAAKAQWRKVADQLRPKLPKLAAFMDQAEADVLAYTDFPAAHRAKIHSTDEIDKPFCCDLLSWRGTGDRAAKSQVRGCEPGRAAFSAAPHLRRPCAAFPGAVAASAARTVHTPARHAGRLRSRSSLML
jgi:hypothetical protein